MKAHLSIKECAEDLGLHPASVWRAIQCGTLRALRHGRIYRVEAKTWALYKASLVYTPAAGIPQTVTPVDSKLIDRISH